MDTWIKSYDNANKLRCKQFVNLGKGYRYFFAVYVQLFCNFDIMFK